MQKEKISSGGDAVVKDKSGDNVIFFIPIRSVLVTQNETY